jgi:hypothetical protein
VNPPRAREEVVEVVEVEADLPPAPETRSAPHGARKSLHPSH